MMQMCRGSGLPEILGIRSHDTRDDDMRYCALFWNGIEILSKRIYMTHNIPHHIDESNADERYTRNFFRHRYSAPMMREYRDAIRRSFRYLEEDNDALD
jgi:tRNA(Ile)-lysidine synthase